MLLSDETGAELKLMKKTVLPSRSHRSQSPASVCPPLFLSASCATLYNLSNLLLIYLLPPSGHPGPNRLSLAPLALPPKHPDLSTLLTIQQKLGRNVNFLSKKSVTSITFFAAN